MSQQFPIPKRPKPFKLKPHDLSETIVTEPENPPQLLVVRGWLGRASSNPASNLWRIYLSLAFDECYELEADSIWAVNDVNDSASFIWVLRDAPMRHVKLTQVPADDFLAGPIARRAVPGYPDHGPEEGGPEPSNPCSSCGTR
jgi:hypothetical protein